MQWMLQNLLDYVVMYYWNLEPNVFDVSGLCMIFLINCRRIIDFGSAMNDFTVKHLYGSVGPSRYYILLLDSSTFF